MGGNIFDFETVWETLLFERAIYDIGNWAD